MEDFETPASRIEFEELCLLAQPAFELPIVGGYTADQLRKDGIGRNHQYAHVGAYIVRHTQILLALWNGVHHQPENIGGTAQIVSFALSGVTGPYSPVWSSLDPPEAGGVVYHISTPSPTHPQVTTPPGNVQKLPAEARELARRTTILSHIEDFSRDCHSLRASLTGALPANMEALVPAADSHTLPPEVRRIRQCYAVADSLAQQFLGRTRSAHNGLLILVGVAVVLFEVFVHFDSYVEMGRGLAAAIEGNAAALGWDPTELFPAWLISAADWIEQQARIALLLYLGVTGLAWVSYQRAVRRRYQAKYLDYRALAEAMRIEFFWRLTGMGSVDESVADHYLSHQASELDWRLLVGLSLGLTALQIVLNQPNAVLILAITSGTNRRSSRPSSDVMH